MSRLMTGENSDHVSFGVQSTILK